MSRLPESENDVLRVVDASEPEPTYDLNQPEDVFFQLDDGGVINVAIITDTSGFATCEQEHGCLDYMIKQGLDDDLLEGSFVLTGCTGAYIRGDGWMTDDDAEFYPGAMRPATAEEIAEYGEVF